jgi:hypothetical protein
MSEKMSEWKATKSGYKNQQFLYISKEQNEKEIRRIISLKVAIKIKYRGMN